jgi:starch-binding outer membrane protein, SusD/RagB family
MNRTKLYIAIIISMFLFLKCSKLIEVAPPIDSVTNEQIFSDSINASSAVIGTYQILNDRNSGLFGSAFYHLVLGLYSDELQQGSYFTTQPFYTSDLPPNNTYLTSSLWAQPYNLIYHTNIIIEEVQKSNGITEIAKRQFVGEAKFIRAFCYLSLEGMFGGVPIITTPDYRKNQNVPKSTSSSLINFVIEDLKNAKDLLPPDYNKYLNSRQRATSFAASALLARAYLFNKQYDLALIESDRVIKNLTLYEMLDDPRTIFDPNSKEVILQAFLDPNFYPYNITGEGMKFIPLGYAPTHYLRPTIVRSFDYNDERRGWIDSITYEGVKYYYSKKFYLGADKLSISTPPTQIQAILRVAECYLIRSEANLMTGKIHEALDDLNAVRGRSGLKPIYTTTTSQVFEALIEEKKKEFLLEFGHRWIDIRRWGISDSINSPIKNSWKKYKDNFPIPNSEIQKNSALIQNDGY